MTYETTHTFKTARFTVRLAAAPEPGSPDWFGAEEDIIRIERGELQYFAARVTVECDGNRIGTDYLGGCCYESVDQFRRDPYFYDMVRSACRQARRALANPPKMRAVA